ncbi:DUF2127 domain-containing protein [bacterium]|nr:DUF2127 domain-containing protein [bacterium]
MFINPASWLGRWLHWLFEASLVLKGMFAAGETLAGLGLLLTPNISIINLVGWLIRHNLTQEPDADMAKWVHHVTEVFPIQVQHFYAYYLLAHGVLKFLMVVMLARRILWAYPVAMLILAGFVSYQMTEFFRHGSIALMALSGFDAFMIGLVYREWGVLKLLRSQAKPA